MLLGSGALAMSAFGCSPVPELVVTVERTDEHPPTTEPGGGTGTTTDVHPRTTEAGGTVKITIQLARKPEQPVIVHGESSDTTEGEVSGDLRFDQLNWSTPQTLTVRGVDDSFADGDVPYEIRLQERPLSAAGDEAYLMDEVELVNVDDDGATFRTLGDLPRGDFNSEVIAMSDDGDIIIGYGTTDSGPFGFRWTLGTGMQPVSRGAGIGAISPNGSLIVGAAITSDPSKATDFAVWAGAEPPRVIGPLVDGPSANDPVVLMSASVVLDDGYVYGSCLQYGGHGQQFGCRVNPAGGVAPFGSATRLNVVDQAGNYGGARDGDRVEQIGTRAILNGEVLGTIRGCSFVETCTAEVLDISADARVAVGIGMGLPSGRGQTQLVPSAFVHTDADPMHELPDLPGGLEARSAKVVSDDGLIIAGSGNDENDQQAVVWIDLVPHRLSDLLAEAGATLPPGYRLVRVIAMSADGTVFAGNASNPKGKQEAFRAVLPRMH